MARIADGGSREMSEDDSNDDSISITSTALSEEKETYPLEGIWAERNNAGVMEYLVKWEGYPEVRNTWETHASFQDEEDKTFQDWEEQKMRISRGFIKPFDVLAFEDRWFKWQAARDKRKMRRRNKRIRLGIPVAPLEFESEEDIVSDGTIEEAGSDHNRPSKRRRILKRRDRTRSDDSEESSESDSHATDTEGSQGLRKPTQRQWDSKQQSALMNGLERFKGPRWGDILSMHPLLLKDFTASDLEDQARVVKNQFKESGRDIPPYLQSVSDKPSTKTTIRPRRESRKSSRTQSREQSITNRKSDDDTNTSTDSLMGDLKSKDEASSMQIRNKPVPAARESVSDTAEKHRGHDPVGEVNPRAATTPPVPSNKLKAPAHVDVRKKQPSAATLPVQTVDQRVRTPQVAASAQMRVMSKPGPAGASTGAPMGGIGRGPRRPAVPTQSSYMTKKPTVTGASVLSNWNRGKVHGNSSVAVKDQARKDGPAKVHDKHSIIRRIVRKGRTEPTPDMSSLHFIDPKDGKAVKEPVRRPKEVPTKTPYQTIQERRAEEPESTLIETPTNDLSWMDEMEDEITVGQSKTTSNPVGQAPQASMKSGETIESTKKRASIPLSTYIQRSQAPPPPPPPTPPQPPPLPPQPSMAEQPSRLMPWEKFSDTANPSRDPVSSSGPLPPSLPTAQPSKGSVSQTPYNAPSATGRFQRPLHAASPPVVSSHATQQGFHPPESPRGLEQIIASRSYRRRDGVLGLSHANGSSDIHGNTYTGPDHQPLSGPFATTLPSESSRRPEPASAINNRTPLGADLEPSAKGPKDDVYAEILTGPDRTMVGSAMWRRLERPARQELIKNGTGPRQNYIWFSHICTAADYKSRFHVNMGEYFGAGYIVPYPINLKAIDDMAELLKLHVSGTLYHAKNFTLLAYPHNSEDWAFLDDCLPPVPMPQVTLRFVMRTPIRDLNLTTPEPHPGRPEIERRMTKKGKGINVGSEQGINTVMRLLYEIDYSRLIQQAPLDKSPESAKFFLLFPKEVKDEQDLVVQFLSSNNALEIYTYDPDKNDAAWSYFRSTVEAGIIIAHSSFWQFHLIPHLAYVLKKQINVWSLSLYRDKKMLHPHLTRLFPHGRMLLLTDSLILLQPLDAVRILAWFRLKILIEKPAGTWNIVTRPGLRNYCLNCCNERKDHEEGKRFVEIYQELVYMLDPDDLYDFDEDKPREEAPIHFMTKIKSFNTKVGRRVDYNRNLDHAAIAKNDEVLVEFFAGWASCNMEHYRRFHVISGFEDASPYGKAQRDKWAEKYSYLEIFTPSAFHSRNKVPSKETLDTLAAQKHKEVMAEYDRRDAELDASSKRDAEEFLVAEASRKKDWERMCETNPKLRETNEQLERDMQGQWSDDEKQAEVKERDWDEWSNDDSSSAKEDFEMGEVSKGDREMLTPSESSAASESEESSS